MTRRIATAALLATLVLSGLLTTGASATVTVLPLPDTMAAVGDSITQAASSAGSLGVDAPQNSWVTGTSSSVNSHYLRLLALGAQISGAHNLSVSGAKVGGLAAQMQSAANLKPDYLTVLIGGNDVCTDTVAEMTSVEAFREQLNTAMATLKAGSPNTDVYVVSIPDAYQLWSLFNGDFWARFIWSVGGVCQSLLANPTSTQQVDVQRRQTVRQRNIDFNTQLAQACAAFGSHCRFDANAVFNTQFAKSDVAGDYFHPSVAGQAKLASGTWAAGYTWAASPPANVAPTAAFTSSCVDLACTFTDTSTDIDGTIAGRSWSFGDGGSSTAASAPHSYAAAGTFVVALTVTDDDGASGSSGTSITVSAPSAPTPMWISGLTSSRTSSRNSWTATVRITVVGPGPVSGVSVVGSWSAGSGDTGCTTGSDGTCVVASSSLNKKTPTVTFTVNGLTKTGWQYDSTKNAATSITIQKP